ncbi:unnamed protein product [Lepeophtheirus salmonis]|uniref:(salmon louse) hypothetical protein n=1 Tax=Lepeophtheirus salmonis TaxID=72036 RepID=A0A7R8CZ54_LEPSM|nr:unnamed protein product [Lepeophtheirus salmonis]CAF2972927.1 unnamed protein product [Lepeophtheirus salmonis]
METKNSKAKDVFDKVKTDVRLMKEELNGIERNLHPKDRSLTQLKSSLEAMQTTKEGLEAELNQELLATLSSKDQDELVQALQEISVEDRNRQLENSTSELDSLDGRIKSTQENVKSIDKKLQDIQKKRKKGQAELESYRLREREIAEKIEEDAKELEKMASKQTVYQNKDSGMYKENSRTRITSDRRF